MLTYYESAKHPLGSTVVRPYHIRSESKGGSTSNVIGIDDVTVPASPNFPPTESGASTSYFIFLDWDIYKTSTNSTGFSVRNETQGVDLSIVDPSVGLSNYTCKLYSTISERRNVLEVHVGSTSNVASDTLSLEGYASGMTITAGQIRGVNEFTTSASELRKMQEYIYQIGAWDMDADAQKNVLSTVASSFTIVASDCQIWVDDVTFPTGTRPITWLSSGVPGGTHRFSYTTHITIVLDRQSSAIFDKTTFNSTSQNRGFVWFKGYF